LKILWSLLFICLNLFAEPSVFENSISTKINVLNENEQKIYKNIAPSDEIEDFQSTIKDPFISQSSLVLTSHNYPSRVYVGEVFSITLEAKTNENTNFDFDVSVDKNKELNFLNPNPKWSYFGDTYKTTLWFEAKTTNANLSQITLFLKRNKVAFQEAKLVLNPIKFELPPFNKDFSHIVASSLEVKKIKTSRFDDKNIIMMLELNATNANLKSFAMNGVLKQGVENLKGDFNSSNAFYYAVFPDSKTYFNFSYFNKDKQKLENLSFKLKISDEELSTQSDLNPINKEFNIYKQYAFWFLAFLLALIFVFKKAYFVLILAVISFALGLLVDTNTHSGILKQDVRVKILPTEPSTYFYTTEFAENVEILGKRESYVKILLKNGKIGWVNDEDLQQN